MLKSYLIFLVLHTHACASPRVKASAEKFKFLRENKKVFQMILLLPTSVKTMCALSGKHSRAKVFPMDVNYRRGNLSLCTCSNVPMHKLKIFDVLNLTCL